jgi:ribosomal protein S27AE
MVAKALKDSFTWQPKARKFVSENGYTVKVKARLNHECHRCGETIEPNEEYYRLAYYDSYTRYPICESCWSGTVMDAHNKSSYKPTRDFATDGKRYWRSY